MIIIQMILFTTIKTMVWVSFKYNNFIFIIYKMIKINNNIIISSYILYNIIEYILYIFDIIGLFKLINGFWLFITIIMVVYIYKKYKIYIMNIYINNYNIIYIIIIINMFMGFWFSNNFGLLLLMIGDIGGSFKLLKSNVINTKYEINRLVYAFKIEQI